MTTPLARTRPAAPIRMVHFGLGNFYRAHQAWYTHHASDAADWGYAAFEGRTMGTAAALRSQDNVYTIAFTTAGGDRYECIESITMSYDAEDHRAWADLCAAASTAIISATVTEAGYCSDGKGGVNLGDPAVAEDIERLRAGRIDVNSTPARLVAGLLARRASGAGPVALMSCDNLLENGTIMRQVVRATAAQVDPMLNAWIDENVSFVTTMVDRITPRPTDEDLARVESGIGTKDAAPIITEPFGEWVIDGEFPAGRPDWASAGATFTHDIDSNEQRKLWLLNGSHSMLAYIGMARGRETVAEAMADEVCRATVQSWWDSALTVLEGDKDMLRAYTLALTERFDNPRIRHLLMQIGTDGTLKIPVRWIPALAVLRSRGELPASVAKALAAYALYVQRGDVQDVAKDALLAAAGADAHATLRNVLSLVAPQLLADAELLAAIDAEITAFAA